MTDTSDSIRQRIDHYRRMLADGVPTELARVYLEQLARDHAKLRDLGEEIPPEPQRTAPPRT